ncbi:PAS domain S-box protein [Puniceicoccaceae bacterium K14]|nr:PAS domain S-box protein [Puniceicoccaceae bacterium K14]
MNQDQTTGPTIAPETHSSSQDLLKASLLAESLLEFSSEGILVLNRTGGIENINNTACGLLNVDQSESIGKSVADVFNAYHPTTHNRIDLSDERYRNPQLAAAQAYVSNKQGQQTHISFQLRPNTNTVYPELSGALLFIRDLSENEITEAQIRLIATALKSIGEAVIITDTNWNKGDARILYTNDGFTEITGYSESDVIGKGLSLLNGPNTDQSVIDEMVEDIEQGQTTAGESVGYRKDGAEFILAWKIFPVYGRPGEITNYVVIQRDVSQIRRLEQDLFQSQKMEAVGRLAGGIAHDFNNILAVILSFSDLVLDKTDDTNPHKTYLEEIRKAAERAADLTQQLLSFSRRNKNLKPRILDAVAVTRDMQKILQRLIPEDIRFHLNFKESPIHININRTALEQILINFTTNARDAMPNGGEVSLSIQDCNADESDKLLPEYMERQDYMVLTFQDNGMGIDQNTQRHIFEPFFTTKETGKGTGLGLSTVYGIVKQSNGHIEVSSEIGQGTQFRIFIPAINVKRDEEPKQVAPGNNNSLSSKSRERILVVEDDETMCDCISGLLVQYNYEVFSTNQAEDALDFFEQPEPPFDLLITDLLLPRMKGSELAKRLLEVAPEMKVIYMTGYSDEMLVDFDLPDDAVVLKKPFSLKSALTAIQSMLRT